MSAISFDAVLRKIRIAFIAAALAVAVFGVASYVTISRLVEFAETAVGTQDKLLLLEQLNSSLSRTQAALREYIMNKRPRPKRWGTHRRCRSSRTWSAWS